MRDKPVSLRLDRAFATVFALLVVTDTHANAQRERLLYSFNSSGGGGDAPDTSLICDKLGNLYGMTSR